MSTTKVGVLTYNKYFNGINLGDYIQSIAASTFFEKIDYYLEREGLDDYRFTERIKVILNGWFMHSPENWPPCDAIIPLFVSFHLSKNNFNYQEMLSPAGIAYFKKYEPVGCRDYGTMKLLGKYGVNVYFSGCLTLTLGRKYQTEIKTDDVYFVDVPFMPTVGRTKYLLKNLGKVIKQLKTIRRVFKRNKKIVGNFVYSLVNTAVFCCLYSNIFEKDILEKTYFTSHLSNRGTLQTDDDCFGYAESLIKKYASAKLVVTSLLHCALPSLGLGTPVVFINHEKVIHGRFDGLLELMRVFEFKDNNFSTSDIDIKEVEKISCATMIKNKEDYLILKENLEKRCKEFAQKI